MKRIFHLSEISPEEFSFLDRQVGPPHRMPPPETEYPRKYFRMLDTAEYRGLPDLLREIDDGVQHMSIVSANDRGYVEAARRTRKDRERYFAELVREEGKHVHLYVGLIMGNRSRRHIHEDILDFYKENGIWRLRKMGIGRANFKHYRLKLGKRVPLCQAHRIYGVFPPGAEGELSRKGMEE